MEGEAHWLTGAVILGGGALVVALMWAAARAGGRLVSETYKLVCPVRKHEETCLVTWNVDGGRFTDVESCSAFDPPGCVACAKTCLGTLSSRPPIKATA